MLAAIEVALLILASTLSLGKMLDVTILFVRDLRFHRRPLSSREGLDVPLSPVMSWAYRQRSIVRSAVQMSFRTPTLSLFLSAVVLLGARAVTLRLVAAIVGVCFAFSFLAGVASGAIMAQRYQRGETNRPLSAGLLREAVNDVVPPAIRPMIVVALTTAYAALYHALYLFHQHYFAVPTGGLGTISSVYFSVVTAATVGYGDIQPRSESAQIAVTTQIIATAVVLATLASRFLNAQAPR